MIKTDAQSEVVPRLRFPEFRDTPAWSESALTGICEVNPAHNGLPESFYYIDLESVEAGTLRTPKRIERRNAPSRAQRYLRDGDILYQTVRPYQRNNLLFDFGGEDDYVASTGYAQLRARESIGFLYQLVHTDLFVQRVLAKCTGSNYPAIKSSDLEPVSIWIPPAPAEQRKIAKCLGSLDDMIVAEGRKLAALRDHKKGLMQQLFPREGETRPRLRFPEFRDAPEWDNDEIGSLCRLYQSETLSGSELIEDGTYPVYGANGIIGRLNRFNHEESEVIVTCRGATCGEVHRTIPKAWITGNAMVVKPKDCHVRKKFLFYFLKSNGLKSVISGSAQPQITRVGFSPLTICFPDAEEQHRIADCFASLDAMIAAQAEKIDALRNHKRGLMQQLFPSSKDVSA